MSHRCQIDVRLVSDRAADRVSDRPGVAMAGGASVVSSDGTDGSGCTCVDNGEADPLTNVCMCTHCTMSCCCDGDSHISIHIYTYRCRLFTYDQRLQLIACMRVNVWAHHLLHDDR